MKNIFTIFILLFTNLLIAQNEINADNYYSHFKDHKDFIDLKLEKLGTSRLSESEISTILKDEMKLAGFEWLSSNQIIHLGEDNYITSICYSSKSIFGFVLETIFDAIPDKENRKLKCLARKCNGDSYDYGVKIMEPNGDYRYVKIVHLPDNLFLIKQDIYWYQTTENISVQKTLVTKEIASNILRSDVKNILKSIKK